VVEQTGSAYIRGVGLRGAKFVSKIRPAQVKEHTMHKYRNEFQPLIRIPSPSLTSISSTSLFGKTAQAWDIRDILQRLGCFLKDKQNLDLKRTKVNRRPGSDPTYWLMATSVILPVKSEMLQERLTLSN
jgi:hypothetical protein